jgi:hypothetical protein
MTDTEQLAMVREAVTARMETVSDDRLALLLAHDYHPREHRIRRWPTVGAFVATLGITAGILVAALSTGATSAFAGWTPVPQQATVAAIAKARGACNQVPAGNVVASESRGPYTAIVYTRDGNPWQCVSEGTKTLLNKTTAYPLNVVVKPGAGKVSLPMFNHTARGRAATRVGMLNRQLMRASDQAQIKKLVLQIFATETSAEGLTAASGYLGSGVTAVTFVLHDGTHVKATVGAGWYLAWWPGSNRPYAKYPAEILITTATGTHRAPYSQRFLRRYYRPCWRSCIGRPVTEIDAGVATAIIRNFGLFRREPTKATNVDQLPKRLRNELGFPERVRSQFGLDESQARVVWFGRNHGVLAIPGREGLCDIQIPDGGGGCEPLMEVGHGINGEMGSGVEPDGRYHAWVEGLVPDGFTKVTVRLASGRTTTLRVRDNAYLGTFSQRAEGVSARNAAGRVIH